MNDAARIGLNRRFVLFVVSYGGSPDGDQRRALAGVIRDDYPAMVMLTNSHLNRVLMRAFSNANPKSEVLRLDEEDAGFDFLGLNGEEREAARRLRRELEAELGLASGVAAPGRVTQRS